MKVLNFGMKGLAIQLLVVTLSFMVVSGNPKGAVDLTSLIGLDSGGSNAYKKNNDRAGIKKRDEISSD